MLRSQISSRPPLWMLFPSTTSILSGAAHLHTTQSTQVPLRSRRTRSSSQLWLWLKRSSLLMHKLRPTARPSTARIRMRSAQMLIVNGWVALHIQVGRARRVLRPGHARASVYARLSDIGMSSDIFCQHSDASHCPMWCSQLCADQTCLALFFSLRLGKQTPCRSDTHRSALLEHSTRASTSVCRVRTTAHARKRGRETWAATTTTRKPLLSLMLLSG